MHKVKKSSVRNVGKKNITVEENSMDKEVLVPPREFVFFFIGGAGDKESYYGIGPTNLIADALTELLLALQAKGYDIDRVKSRSHHIGYADAKGSDDINEKIISKIEDTSAIIYLIGHSLGGWNSAHLSKILTEKGYQIEFLVTLDPVGEGVAVSLLSDIYWEKPEPRYAGKNWINIRAEVDWKNYIIDDFIADIGNQWDITDGPLLNETVAINHGNARAMFTYQLSDGKSAMEHLINNFMIHVKSKPSKLPNIELNS